MRKTQPKAIRVSLGFTEREWRLIQEALKVRYHTKNPLAEMSAQERCQFLVTAIYAISAAITRQRVKLAFLACDVRPETEVEMIERMGGPVTPYFPQTNNLAWLPPARGNL